MNRVEANLPLLGEEHLSCGHESTWQLGGFVFVKGPH